VIYLLNKVEGGYYLCLSPVGYVGYIKEGAVRALTEEEAKVYQEGQKAILIRDYGTTETGRIPMGAKLRVLSSGEGKCEVLLADGMPKEVGVEYVSEIEPRSYDNFSEELIKRAREYLGTEYVFGGKATGGTDCSGFTQIVYRTMGFYLPRDARQQALVGELSGARWYRDGMKQGDLLYFIDHNCRVIHVGIYMDGGKFIHCSPPICKIESFNEGEGDYSEVWDKAFVFSKRVADF
jgi:hypothetical protein